MKSAIISALALLAGCGSYHYDHSGYSNPPVPDLPW